MSFGSKFKNRRLEMGLTQERFANEFNKRYNYSFNKSTISNYENDFRTPEMTVLTKLAEFMSLSTDYLLGLSDNPSPSKRHEEPQQNQQPQDEFLVAFYGNAQDLSDDAKNDVLRFMEFLKEKEKMEKK